MTASAPGKRPMITALFGDEHSAERAYQACVERGYEIGEVNVIMSEDTRARLTTEESDTASLLARRKAEGGELGGPSGGRVEMLVTIIAAVGAALALPGSTAAQTTSLTDGWIKWHDDYAKLSTRGVNLIVRGAGHGIQRDKPAAVIGAVDAVLAQARQR